MKTPSKIAVDVALLPPREIAELAIKLNRSFPDTAKENYILDETSCVPHITLLMGLIEKDRQAEVEAKLKIVASKLSPLDLRITGFDVPPRTDGRKISALVIEKTTELQRLHETVLEEMGLFFSYDDVTPAMFYMPPPVNEIPLFWVRGFAKTSVRDQYKPHITLGLGEPTQLSTPIEFRTSALALCHLGNYCTCRKILWSVKPK